LRPFTAWLLNGSALIAVLSAEFRQGLIAMGVDADRVVCTCTMYDASGLDAAARDVVAAPAARSILFMSRFTREKGVYELLQAFIKLAQDFPDVELVMAGDGEEMSGLQAAAALSPVASRIKFPGYIGGADKWRLLRSCTVYALPTYMRGEGMPVALLEALGAGKPVLVGVAGSIRSIVSEPENGIVIENISTQTVEAGLRRLLQDPGYCAAIGARNLNYARQRFEASAVTAGVEAMYRTIAQKA
jgi:glycosyltransferase involved in cell wall biosynthesis